MCVHVFIFVILYIYFLFLLTSRNCNIQCAGETLLPLHKRIDTHCKAKSGCDHMVMHFRNDVAGSSFVIQILEIFFGTGYRINIVCPVDCAKRLRRGLLDEDTKGHVSLWPK